MKHLLGFLLLASVSSFAATQGKIGPSSTATLKITLVILPEKKEPKPPVKVVYTRKGVRVEPI